MAVHCLPISLAVQSLAWSGTSSLFSLTSHCTWTWTLWGIFTACLFPCLLFSSLPSTLNIQAVSCALGVLSSPLPPNTVMNWSWGTLGHMVGSMHHLGMRTQTTNKGYLYSASVSSRLIYSQDDPLWCSFTQQCRVIDIQTWAHLTPNTYFFSTASNLLSL